MHTDLAPIASPFFEIWNVFIMAVHATKYSFWRQDIGPLILSYAEEEELFPQSRCLSIFSFEPKNGSSFALLLFSRKWVSVEQLILIRWGQSF